MFWKGGVLGIANWCSVETASRMLSTAVNDTWPFSRAGASGFFSRVVQALGAELAEAGTVDLAECFIDGMFAPAKKGGRGIGKTKRGKGSKIMMLADAHGLPLGAHVASATSHEIKVVDATLTRRFVKEPPSRLIGDGAYAIKTCCIANMVGAKFILLRLLRSFGRTGCSRRSRRRRFRRRTRLLIRLPLFLNVNVNLSPTDYLDRFHLT